jgi:hypothetical protein
LVLSLTNRRPSIQEEKLLGYCYCFPLLFVNNAIVVLINERKEKTLILWGGAVFGPLSQKTEVEVHRM